VLEPIFEADFVSVSYGFRPRRSATQAMERLRVGFIEGITHVVEFDIRNFFGEIEHDRLLGWSRHGCRTGGCSSWSASGWTRV
jgi:RNA-directed DNA polymerase